jgi:hypothetical protein
VMASISSVVDPSASYTTASGLPEKLSDPNTPQECSTYSLDCAG